MVHPLLHKNHILSYVCTQDAANSTVLGSQVVGITMEGKQVSNLSEDIIITFHHQPLQVTDVTTRAGLSLVEDPEQTPYTSPI